MNFPCGYDDCEKFNKNNPNSNDEGIILIMVLQKTQQSNKYFKTYNHFTFHHLLQRK